MLKVDENFYILPRGEQVAKMVQYCVSLTNEGGSEQADPSFIPEFLESVSGRYTWQLNQAERGQLLYNSAVLNVLTSLLNDDHQDVDLNTSQFLSFVEDPTKDIKARRLAMVGLHTLVELDTPFVVSAATATDVAETLSRVVTDEATKDAALRIHCVDTIADLLDQKRVPHTQAFMKVAALPEAAQKPVFHAPERYIS